MNNKEKLIPSIFIMIIVIVVWLIKPAHSTEHEWMVGEFANVIAMCKNDAVLRTVADLYMTKNPYDANEAMKIWTASIISGECVSDNNYTFTVLLTEKLKVYKDLYSDGQNGELWRATVMISGGAVSVYVGMLERKGLFQEHLPSISL
jgi:hypothetical protein